MLCEVAILWPIIDGVNISCYQFLVFGYCSDISCLEEDMTLFVTDVSCHKELGLAVLEGEFQG